MPRVAVFCVFFCCGYYDHHCFQHARPLLRRIDLQSHFLISVLSFILDVSFIVCLKSAPQYVLESVQIARDYSASKFLHMSGYSTSDMRETRPLLGKENMI